MKSLPFVVLLFAGLCSAMAQVPAPLAPPTDNNAIPSVPEAQVQPVVQKIVERTTVVERPTKNMSREERRAYKVHRFAERIDSLVQSRDYVFWPNSMQEIRGGAIQMIYNEYFYFGFFIDHAEIHLPTERGASQFIEVLNFDSMNIRNYQASPIQAGWNVHFQIVDGAKCYVADFIISTVTGEAILNLLAPDVSMRYVGSILGHMRDFKPMQ
ncbi:MAG: hypothetical protein RR330_05000 [Alistipes sp.]